MAAAEANARKNRKAGPGTDRLANAARLGVLEKHLGIEVKRYRDPGDVGGAPERAETRDGKQDKDETIVVGRETF